MSGPEVVRLLRERADSYSSDATALYQAGDRVSRYSAAMYRGIRDELRKVADEISGDEKRATLEASRVLWKASLGVETFYFDRAGIDTPDAAKRVAAQILGWDESYCNDPNALADINVERVGSTNWVFS